MACEHTAHENRGGVGVGFGLGVLAGAAIGVAIGLLVAPKEGSRLRRDLARKAGHLRDDAIDQFERAADAAADAAAEAAARGKDVAERARTAVKDGLREVRRYTSASEEPV
jgi:gas vesicle protein